MVQVIRCRILIGFISLGILAPILPHSPAQQKDTPTKDYAAELPRIPPTEPKDALKSFKLAPSFAIELVASEPAIRSPVAVDFDEDGRMYVAEFPEYNQHQNPNFKERGAIKLLEDTKGTGVYDKVTTFAEIDAPVALACWDGGIFVGSVPNIYYLKDTKGTGQADLRKVIYTGFARDKAGEAMLNSFRWGLDNRIHLSTGMAGGNVKRADSPDAKAVNVRNQGFVFDPRTLNFELVAGSAQHGMSMDDLGRKFMCDNSNPALLLMYDGRYLLRNPYVEAPPPLVNIHGPNQANYLKRISPNEPWRIVRTRLRLAKEVPGPTETGEVSGHFTGTTGVTVYRGDAFPREHVGTLFVGEVANNLVYHARLEPKGLELKASRFEKDMEFLASTDNWFRPCQFANAPDGTLYVIDHYREIIETVESIPPMILKHLHIDSGVNRGRIYRVVPDGFKRPPLPKLSKATTAELVKLLEHPNGWHRDTAARVLYQRQDTAAAPLLKALAKDWRSPLGRIHALRALEGLAALKVEMVMAALKDPEPRVREQALTLAEHFPGEEAIRNELVLMVNDNDPLVRYQLAFSLGATDGPRPALELHSLANFYGDDPWMRMAVLTSAQGRRGELFRWLWTQRINKRHTAPTMIVMNALATQIGSANQAHELAEFLRTLQERPSPEEEVGELMTKLMSKLPPKTRDRIGSAGKTGEIVNDLIARALKAAGDKGLPVPERVSAVRTLAFADFAQARPTLAELLSFRQPEAIQRATLETIRNLGQKEAGEMVIDAWPSLSPQLRASAMEEVLARPIWVGAFVDALETGKIKTSEIDSPWVRRLQAYFGESIRERTQKLFKSAELSKRSDVLASYQKSLALKGDATNGKALFKKHCAACHRLEGVGEQIGAELGAIKERGPDFILLNILDPNREVLPKFITYIATTDAGLTLTGMITAETATSITLRRPDGASTTLLRVNIQELRSTGMSFMPEGLEKAINHQEMADLLAYLQAAS